MKTITILITGLIALVPGQGAKEYVALLINDQGHTPGLIFIDSAGKEHRFGRAQGPFYVQLFDGMSAARPDGGSLSLSETVEMQRFRNGNGVSFGLPVELFLKERLAANQRDRVFARFRFVADSLSVTSFPPVPKWDFSPNLVDRILADRLVFRVSLNDPRLLVEDPDSNRLAFLEVLDDSQDDEVRFFNTLPERVWCPTAMDPGLCNGKELRHVPRSSSSPRHRS